MRMLVRHLPKSWNSELSRKNPEKWIVTLGSIERIGEFDSKERAYKLAESWNQHDTLKAKAELLDEMLPIYTKLLSEHDTCYCYDSEVNFKQEAESILKKAEALK